jgi:hypothetical protein
MACTGASTAPSSPLSVSHLQPRGQHSAVLKYVQNDSSHSDTNQHHLSLSLSRAWPRNKGGAWRPPQHSPIKKAPPGPGPASRVRPNGGTTKKGRHEKGSSSQQGAPPVFSSISVLGESRRRRLRRRRQRGQKWLRLAGGRESRQLHGRLVGRLMSTTWFGVPCC